MKWYTPFACEHPVRNPIVCNEGNVEEMGYTNYFFEEGRYIEDWKEGIYLRDKDPNCDTKPDDALQNYLMAPIFSPRFIEALNEANITGIQYLPVKIMRSDNIPLEGFYFANITNFVEAFDYEKSNYVEEERIHQIPDPTTHKTTIMRIRRYVLKADKLEGFDIIRLKDAPEAFFVSEKFVDVFKKNRFTGYSFRLIELS